MTNVQIYTYFIQALDTGLIKIGKSNDPKKRLRSLQTANGAKLVLLGVSETFSENDLHVKFKRHRSNGEWFLPDLEIIKFLEDCGFRYIQPEKKERKIEFSEGHPFQQARKLFEGEWYDLDDFNSLYDLFKEDWACIDKDDNETDDEFHLEFCDGCLAHSFFDNLHIMLLNNDIDGLIINGHKICVVFRRDRFGYKASEIRDDLHNIAWRLDDADTLWSIYMLSWTESGGFRFEGDACVRRGGS